MKEIRGSIEINAPVGRVWQIITDFGSYPTWNPWITLMDGDPKIGSKVKVIIKVAGRKDTKLASEVMKLETNREVLLKSSVIKGLLGDNHSLKFEVMGDNKTRFSQDVVFQGMMSPFIGGIVRDQQKGLDLMNEATKKLCEGKVGIKK
jgi:hypothetical protein